MVGIEAFGAYVPRLRLQRAAMAEATAWFNQGLAALGKGERSMAGWDEDTLTMAVEAGRDCLVGRERAEVGKVILASTTFPFADRQNAGVVKEALNLSDALGVLDVGGSQRAGTSALVVALESAAANAPVLCVASEHRIAKPASEAEFVNGDAAAAFLIGRNEVVADFIGAHSIAVDFVDHFRASDQSYQYEWESRWVRDEGYRKLLPAAVSAALAKFGLDVAAIDHLIVPLPMAGADRLVASAIGVRPDVLCHSLRDTLGFAGAAHPLVLLASVLERAKPGELVVLTAFGQGCDVLAFRTTEALARPRIALGVGGWLARRRPEANYVKHLAFVGELALDGGMRSEINVKTPFSMLYRDRKTILSLVGGRCRETGTVQYPRSDISVAQNARLIDTQDDYPLADLRARVVSATADRLAYTPDPPACYGLIEFEGGGRLAADFTDVDPDGLEPGAFVRMMFRLKRTDAVGFRHYFWKAAPDFRPAD